MESGRGEGGEGKGEREGGGKRVKPCAYRAAHARRLASAARVGASRAAGAPRGDCFAARRKRRKGGAKTRGHKCDRAGRCQGIVTRRSGRQTGPLAIFCTSVRIRLIPVRAQAPQQRRRRMAGVWSAQPPSLGAKCAFTAAEKGRAVWARTDQVQRREWRRARRGLARGRAAGRRAAPRARRARRARGRLRVGQRGRS